MNLLFFFLISIPAFAGTSEENRSGLKSQAAYQLGWDYRMSTHQLMLATFITPQEQLVYKIGSARDTEDPDDQERYQFNAGLQYKMFQGNSFYVSPEIFYLNFVRYHDLTGQTNKRITSVGLGVRLGNQWQWKNFTLGCDWFGLTRNTIYWNAKKTSSSDDLNFTLLGFYLGISI